MPLISTSATPRRRSFPHQPQVHDFGLSPSLAVAGIQDAASNFNLNCLQLKRIASLCHIMYIHMATPGDLTSMRNRNETTELLRKIHARCAVWQKANLVKSVARVPEEMNLFEQHCITKCKSYGDERYNPTPEDVNSEKERMASAILEIVSTEPHRSEAMELSDKAAEILVSQIQMTLDTCSTLDDRLRQECFKALRKLGARAGVLPSRAKIVDEVVFKSQHPTAEGGYSFVYEATWNGKNVAVKRPRRFAPQSGESSRSTHENEQTLLEILLSLQLSHPFVLPLLGVIEEEGPSYSMVYEWMYNGTVEKYLKQNPNSNRPQIIFQIAQGLKYLHTHVPEVVHGDLKSANVLIDPHGCPRIADFGQSCLNYSIVRTNTSHNYVGTERYLAPELLLPPKSRSADHGDMMPRATLEGDIWSFAMLMYEIFTGTMIFPGVASQIVLLDLVDKRKLPPRPPRDVTERGLSDEFWGLMLECWKYNPSERPKIDYVVRNLERLTHSAPRTAMEIRTDTEYIPVTLVKQIITDDGANWKELDVKLVLERGNIVKNGLKLAVISITGDASTVAEVRHRISEAIPKTGHEFVKREIHVSKEFHGLIHGKERVNLNKLEQKFGVRIRLPVRESNSEKIVVEGTSMAVASAQAEIDKSIAHGKKSRKMMSISPRAAELVSEREQTFRPLLRNIIVDIRAGTVKLFGDPEGMEFARRKIKEIEAAAASEVLEEVPVLPYICDSLRGGGKAWTDIIERCCGSEHIESMGKYGLMEVGLSSLKIRGPREQIMSVRGELQQMTAAGDECVMGKRVAARHHRSMLEPQKQLIKHVREWSGAMIYFPESGGYEYAGVPNNMDRYDDDDPKDIVKVVGSVEACTKGRDFLEELIQKEGQHPGIMFPGALQNIARKLMGPRFRLLGLSMETDTPQTTIHSMAMPNSLPDTYVGFHPVSLSDRGLHWAIHKCRKEGSDLPQCTWTLKGNSIEALGKGDKHLHEAVKEAWRRTRRIGILQIQNIANYGSLQRTLGELESQDDDISSEILGDPNRVIIAGPSSEKVETAFRKLIACAGLFDTSNKWKQ